MTCVHLLCRVNSLQYFQLFHHGEKGTEIALNNHPHYLAVCLQLAQMYLLGQD